MRNAVRVGLAAALVVLASLSARAEEPYLEFLTELRDRGYYDIALRYLDKIATDPNLPTEVKDVLLYERAMTLMEAAGRSRNSETQTKYYDDAEALLDQFTKAHPNHARSAQAYTDRAQIFLGKARVEITQSKSPANAGNKEPFQLKARDYVKKARTIFQAAHDQHKAAWEKHPHYINKEQEPDAYAARGADEVKYMRAQLDLALCTYEEAQTWDEKSPEYKKLLTEASKEFSKIHEKYRSQVAGLYARMWQAKCFEEEGDNEGIGRALGIYNELLGHPGNTGVMQQLQDQVLQFRLICLNTPQRHDHQLVLQESDAWIAKAPAAKQRSERGIGIRYERARALEALGLNREANKTEKDRHLARAQEDAIFINRYSIQYKDISTAMIQRIKAARGKEGKDPADFESALGLAKLLVQQITPLEEAAETARRSNKPKKEIDDIQGDLNRHLKEAARILKLALDYANSDTDTHEVNQARHYLAYIYYTTGRYYEGAILAEFIAARYSQDDPDLARLSAHIALVAWQNAYSAEKRKDQRSTEINQLIRVATLITKNWPGTEQASLARKLLGQVYIELKRPADAATWFAQVPENSPDYNVAQMSAGQALWSAWLDGARKPADERPPQADLDKWQADSEKHLTIGIDRASAGATSLPDEAVAAKVSLAQIKNVKGQYTDAIKLLVGDPLPVVNALVVKEGEARPPTGIKSRPFYILSYRELLRAYIGTQNIEKALEAMGKLEALAGGPESDEVVEIYVDLGREIQKEMDRVKSDQAKLTEVLASFDKFLGELDKRRDSMSYNSLIWIAETYSSLGAGLNDGATKAKAVEYFGKASAAYTDILNRAEKGEKPEDVKFREDKDRIPRVKVLLAETKRREGDFDGSATLIADVLKQPNFLDAQIAAAQTLQDWGQSGQPDTEKKLVDAVEGAKDGALKGRAWGWFEISKRLRKLVSYGKASERQKEQYYDAAYNAAVCRRLYGNTQSSTDRKNEQLDKSLAEIEKFAALSGAIPEATFDRFDGLYQEVQKDRNPGNTPKPLERAIKVVEKEAPAEKPAEPEPDAAKPTTPVVAPEEKKPEGMGMGMILVLSLVLLGGTGGIIYTVMKPKKKRLLPKHAEETPSFPAEFGMPAAAPAPKPSKPRPAVAPGASPAAASGTATATARRPDGQPAPRPVAKTAKPAAGAPKPAAKPPNPKPPTK